MSKCRRFAALVLAVTLASSALAAPASAIYSVEDRASRSEAASALWIDHLWGFLVSLFAEENGGIVPRP